MAVTAVVVKELWWAWCLHRMRYVSRKGQEHPFRGENEALVYHCPR